MTANFFSNFRHSGKTNGSTSPRRKNVNQTFKENIRTDRYRRRRRRCC